MHIKSFLKNKIVSRATILALATFLFGCSVASAATLQIDSDSATLSTGNIMTLSVVLDSQGVAVNNAEAKIVFPSDLLEVVSISKNSSVMSLWVEEPAFSNITGIITFNGGVPTPGFTGTTGTVVSIVVRAKKAGQAQLIFSDAAVRANDGLGTDVLSSKQGETISIVNGQEAPTKAAPASSGPVLQITSATHPNQDQWYKDNDPVFDWVIPTSADAVQTGIDNNTSGVARVTYTPAISEKTTENLKDGVWYFKARARRDGAWGPTDVYIVRIDTTAPVKKQVDFSYDDNAKVMNITSDIQDITSGIDHYEIFINDTLEKNVLAKEFVSGKYSFGIDASGNNTVRLVAIDRAGNSVEASGDFYATGVSIPEIDPVSSTVPADERLLVSGRTQNPGADVFVNIKHGLDDPITLPTKSNPDGSFFVLTSRLNAGNYEIWAETGSQGRKISSTHIFTEATSKFLVKIGSLTVNGSYLVASIIIVIILLILGAYYLGYRYSRFQHRLKLRTVLVNGNNSKVLSVLKKRLERHLEILQNTRHLRVLTKEEKEIKGAVEGDLDEIDKIIEEQK